MKTGDRLLPEILELTQQMLRNASDDDWEQLQLLEERRRQRIAACFPLDGSVSDPLQAADQIRQIIETGEMVVELVSTARDNAGTTLGGLKQGRSATQAYRLVGG